MDYLSVEEAAVLKNCSARYIRKQCKNGVLPAVIQEHPQNHKPCYQIPVSAFPEPLQARYYQQKRQEMGVMPTPIPAETKPQKPKKKAKAVRQMTIEDCTEAQRQELQVWTEILREWQAGRKGYAKKTDYDKLYVGKCQLEHPDLQISTGILYRKWKAYLEHDLAGMLGIRGGSNKGSSEIPQLVWEAFLWFWLSENQPTVCASYRNTITWTEDFHPELVACIPSERSFRRRIDRDVAEATKILMREGEKAFSDRCMPYIMRMYDQLEPNDVWIADNHTLDIQSLDENGTIHRLYLTAFLDAKSGVITGWNVADRLSGRYDPESRRGKEETFPDQNAQDDRTGASRRTAGGKPHGFRQRISPRVH